MSPVILDGLLPYSLEQKIYNTVTNIEFDWHYNPNISIPEKEITEKAMINDSNIRDTGAFVHSFHSNQQKFDTRYYESVLPIMYFVEKETDLKVFNVERVRGVFAPKEPHLKGFYNVPHIDNELPHKTLIYYVNDNDGDTILFKEKYISGIVNTSKKTIDYSVEPKKGRILIFDGLTFHTGKIPSNNIKLLLNFNFV
jgi:hypothetical protein